METEIGPNQMLIQFDKELNEYLFITVITVYKTKSINFYLCDVERYGDSYKRITKILDEDEIKEFYIVEDVIEDVRK